MFKTMTRNGLAALILSVQIQAAVVEVAFENLSGGVVTNTWSTDAMVLPMGKGVIFLETDENPYQFSFGGVVDMGVTVAQGDELFFTQNAIQVSTARTPLSWFLLGFAFHTSVWVIGWGLKTYKSYGHAVVNALE